MGLQNDLNECVGEGEHDGISRRDLGDDLLLDVSRPLPGTRVAEVVPNLNSK